MPNRVAFLIDGFNLYHSIKQAIADGKITRGKWLNIRGLCADFLSAIGRDAVLTEVHYFSALATHIPDPAVAARHRVFIQALESVAIQTSLGNFKRKRVRCKASCGLEGWGYEEKESDVNLALTLLELLLQDRCDTVIIVSGDTDLACAMRRARTLFPAKKVGVAFPYGRFHNELKLLADYYWRIRPQQYQNHVFPDVITVAGRTITKPSSW
jgi:uncharacterized LabA/DUF88 family protein